MIVLGISAFYHDSAAAIVRDGTIVAAAQEERFTRKKHDAGFPAHAIRYCVAEAGVSFADIDFVTFYEKPFLKFERLLETYLAFAPRGFKSFRMAIPLWLKEKLFQKSLLIELLSAEAPGVDVRVYPLQEDWRDPLRNGELDLKLGRLYDPGPGFLHEQLLTERFIGAVRNAHPLKAKRISL